MLRATRRVTIVALLLALANVTPWPACAQVTAAAGSGQDVPAGIVSAFDRLFSGPHVGQRAVHANGLLCEGIFTPSPGAAELSRATHLQGAPTPVLARFSNFAAVPGLPDGSPIASPRGLAIKFLLPNGSDTDIVSHSYNGFPAATPSDFLAFLRALPNPTALAIFAAEHPAARRFLDDPKPAPASYETETYFGVNALRFVNAAGASRFGRYRVVPVAGSMHLSAEEAASRAPDYLATELVQALRRGPVEFRLLVQLAVEGDPIVDGSMSWPADRPVVELGTLALRGLIPAEDGRQAELTFVPTNLVGGIQLSDDPMLLARTQAYSISAERRLSAH